MITEIVVLFGGIQVTLTGLLAWVGRMWTSRLLDAQPGFPTRV